MQSRAAFFLPCAILLATLAQRVVCAPSKCAVQANVPSLGSVCGSLATSGVAAFYGLPFAQPPTGPLRWRPPEPLSRVPLPQPLDASERKSVSCPQPGNAVQEDCLVLNVYAPHSPNTSLASSSRPVIFFIHGGGFYSGTAFSTAGQVLAQAVDAVVVTPNYRVGPLGFLALQELQDESGTSGNYGLLDQQLALRWVRDNIAAFGGNASSVLLMGESAGAKSVHSLLLSPAAQGLFSSAAIQSCPLTRTARPLDLGYTMGREYAEAVGCGELRGSSLIDCMRALKPQSLIDGDDPSVLNNTWMPVVDGVVLPAQLGGLLDAGKFARVPVLMGSNQDEGLTFTYQASMLPITPERYESVLGELFPGMEPEMLAKVVAQYPPHEGDNRDQASRAFGEWRYICSTRRALRVYSKYVETHAYVFKGLPFGKMVGSIHGADLMYLFGGAPETAANKQLASVMRNYWFYHASGNVNAHLDDGRIEWPEHVEDKFLSLDPAGLEVQIGNGRMEQCDFWDTLDPV